MARKCYNAEQAKRVEEDVADTDIKHQSSFRNVLFSALQPRGTLPGGGQGASVVSIGTGGGSKGGVSTGNASS
jgi:hypothetical protein